MDTLTACVSLIIAILSVSYPILLQVISRLDDKYSSTNILELFNKEKINNDFKLTLISSLIIILVCLMKLHPLFSFANQGFFNLMISKSGIALLVYITIVLVCYFFMLVDKVIVYSTPTSFFALLQEMYIPVKVSHHSSQSEPHSKWRTYN